MATFTWTAGTTDPWSTLTDWSPLPTSTPGTVATNHDVVNFLESTTGNKSVYTVTINSADTFDVATLNIGNATATHYQPALSISGHLLTDKLSYTASVANGVTITINAGGLFDIRSSITNESSSAETVTIAGTGTGGHLEFGSATQSGIGVNQAKVTFNFSNGDGENAGVIEYLSGFNPAGTTASQTITNFALGDGIIFDGANFTGDTFVYASATKTLAVRNSGKTVLTMNNLSGPHLTSSSFVARGNEIVVAPVGSFTWATATSGNWSTAADWSPNNGLYPGSGDNNPGDTALINVTGPAYTVTYNVPSNMIGALTVNSANATLAFNQAVAAALTVTGPTTLTAGTISVASASASLSTGTFVQTGGTFTETAGTVNVTGAASLTTGNSDTILGGKFNAGTLTVGNNLSFLAGTITSGTGGVTIGSGRTVTISAPADLNATSGGLKDGGTIIGSGTIDGAISGSGTLKASGGTLDLTGTFGSELVAAIDATTTSDLKFDNTATIATLTNITSATQTLEVGSKGAVTLTGSSGFNVSGGQIVMSGGGLTDAHGITVGNGTIAGTLIGFGSVNAAISSLGSGNVVEASGGLLSMNGAVAGSGLTYAIANSASSILEITPGPNPTTTGNFDFLGSAGELAFNGAIKTSENIAGLNVGASAANPTNFVDFLGRSLTVTSGFTGSGSGGTVALSDGTTLTLSGVTNGGGAWFVDTLSANGGTELFLSTVVCYAAGTRILTVTGERTVQSLMQGDIVLTLASGDLVPQPVRWIGRRRIDLTAHPRPDTVAPIRIRRDAFAENVPHGDLLVSPDHAVFVGGTLICARQLINGTTIRQETGWAAVEYYHVELDAHAILLAEGLPAESYLNTGNRGFFANSGEPLVLHPDLTDESDYPARAAGSCAPFVTDEASVLPVWQRLAERAAALGQPAPKVAMTADPELRVVAKGRTVRPIYGENGLYIFVLPKGATEVRLVSRSAAPTDARPWLDDRRSLGVSVERIVLRGASELREVPVDHPALVQGWHAVERNGVALRRWTDGEAVLPLPAMAPPTLLEVRAAHGGMSYPTDGEQEQRAA